MTIRSLCEQSGVSTGAFYHHYTSKEDLIALGFASYDEHLTEVLNPLIYCKHKDRDTGELPGGRRESGEPILDTAKRELFEETGALDYQLFSVCACCVSGDIVSYGLLCNAKIKTLGALPSFEIERIHLFDIKPEALTYPYVQPLLFNKIKQWLSENQSHFPTDFL